MMLLGMPVIQVPLAASHIQTSLPYSNLGELLHTNPATPRVFDANTDGDIYRPCRDAIDEDQWEAACHCTAVALATESPGFGASFGPRGRGRG